MRRCWRSLIASMRGGDAPPVALRYAMCREAGEIPLDRTVAIGTLFDSRAGSTHISRKGSTMEGLFAIIFFLIYVGIIVFIFAGMWKTFTKAGQPGWGCIIPIYNVYLLCVIAGRPWWWLLLMLIPIVSIVIFIIVCIDIAKSFGKGPGFGVGLAFLGFIFFPILGFGDAQYQGPAAVGA